MHAGYTDEILIATNGRGVDVVLEMLANVNLGADLKLLARFGRVIVIGSRGEVTIIPRDLMARTLRCAASRSGEFPMPTRRTFMRDSSGARKRNSRPVVGKEIPLGDAARAHKEIMETGALGKIILIP